MAVVHVVDPDKDESLWVVEERGTVTIYLGDDLVDRLTMQQWVEFIAGTFDVPMMLDRLGVGKGVRNSALKYGGSPQEVLGQELNPLYEQGGMEIGADTPDPEHHRPIPIHYPDGYDE